MKTFDRRGNTFIFLLVAAAAVFVTVAHGRANAAAIGTDACGNLPPGPTVWSAVGAPYRICDRGVVVPEGSTLTLDGVAGSFDVVATGRGGLGVEGTLETTRTGPAAGVRFDAQDPDADAQSWGGIGIKGGQYFPTSARVALAHISILRSLGGIFSTQALTAGATLDHVVVEDAGISVTSPATVTNSISRRSPGTGIRVSCRGLPSASDAIRVEDNVVEDAAYTGVTAGGQACGSAVVRRNVVRNSGTKTVNGIRFPAMSVDGAKSTVGATGDIADNHGSGNHADAISLGGTLAGSFTWVTPTNDAADHPFGYFSGGNTVGFVLSGPGTLTVPASGVVKGMVALRDGANLDATAGGAVFTTIDDTTVGMSMCPCFSMSQRSGLELIGNATAAVRDATMRGAEREIFMASTAGGDPVAAVAGTRIEDAKAGIEARGGTLTLSGGSLRRVAGDGVNASGLLRGTVNGTSVSDVAGAGLVLHGDDISVVGATVTRARRDGISAKADLDGRVVVRSNVVADSGLDRPANQTWTPPAAISVAGPGMTVGPGGSVDDNTGGGNALDAIDLSGTIVGDLLWVTPANDAATHAFGYLSSTQLTVRGPGTFRAPKDAVVKVGWAREYTDQPALKLEGVALDATAGGSIFTSYRDPVAGLTTCVDVAGVDAQFRCPTKPRWGGIGIHDARQGAAQPPSAKGSAHIVGATVRRADVVVDATSPSAPGDAEAGIVIRDSRLEETSFRSSDAGPVRITGSTVTDGRIRVIGASPVELVANRLSGACPSISVGPNDAIVYPPRRPRVRAVDNRVLTTSTPAGCIGWGPAMRLAFDTATVGSGGDIMGNTGGGHVVDALELEGTIDSDVTWITPTNAPGEHPLGYLARGTLNVASGRRLTIPAGGIVKVDRFLILSGATLDATAGGATIASYADDVGAPAPPPSLSEGMVWILDSAEGTPGSASLVGARVYPGIHSGGYASQTPAPSRTSLHVTDSGVQGIAVESGSARVERTTFDRGGMSIRGGAQVAITQSRFRSAGISNDDGNLTVDRTIITGNRSDGVRAAGPGRVEISCSTITKNRYGLVTSGSTASVVVVNSNLLGNRYFLVDRIDGMEIEHARAVSARSNWWGQPGGPAPGQVRDPRLVDSSGALSAPSACAPTGGGGYMADSAGGLHRVAVDGNALPPNARISFYEPGRVRAIAMLPSGSGGYVLDAGGALHPFAIGSAAMPPRANNPETFGRADIARGIALSADGDRGYWLDHAGGLHRFSIGHANLPAPARLTWYEGGRARGVFLLPGSKGGFVLDAGGQLHKFAIGTSPFPEDVVSPDAFGAADVARGIVLVPTGPPGYVDNTGGYWLDHAGGLHRFAVGPRGLPPAARITWYEGGRARGVVLLPGGIGGYVLDAGGRLHPFAIANAPMPGPALTPDGYGIADVARGVALQAMP